MTKDIKKFKDNLSVLISRCYKFGDKDSNMQSMNLKRIKELEAELINMYEELNEKPIIKCTHLEWIKQSMHMYEIGFANKNYYVSTYISLTLEVTEEGHIITDDFIFIKEGSRG